MAQRNPQARLAASPRVAAPSPKSFRGECPKCDKLSTHEEFFRERRSAGSEMAARRGEFATVQEWSFRCTACGARNEKVVDERGDLHKWQGHRHIVMRLDG